MAGFRVTKLEMTAAKTVVSAIGTALVLASGLGLPSPWNVLVSLILGAGTVAGVWKKPNDIKSAVVNTPTGEQVPIDGSMVTTKE
jgi:hypothetical protein